MGDLIQNAAMQGLIYSLMAMGLFVSYRILDIADLTVDGSFTLGAAVSAVFTVNGHPLLGVFLAILSGMLAGLVTAFLQTKLKIHPIMAGILTMTGLYSINLRIMDAPNLSLMRMDTIFTPFESLFGKKWAALIAAALIAIVVAVFLFLFFKTYLGLSIRATGNNEAMVRSSSINVNCMKIIALALANGVVALSGAVLAQQQHYADIGMGTGIVIIGLASLIIGEVIIGRRHLLQNILAVMVGSVAYWIIMGIVMEYGVQPSDMKLISALIIILAISYPVAAEKIRFFRQKRNGNSLVPNSGDHPKEEDKCSN